MAQRVMIELLDDLDGSEASETVRFALGRDNYEVDLNSEHARELRDALAPFKDAARKVSGTAARTTRLKADVDTKAVRQWAMDNGIEVSARGRIPDDIVTRYLSSSN